MPKKRPRRRDHFMEGGFADYTRRHQGATA
jgi:hypothetical protein